ncbi:hypothetical protein OsJ_26955 [Oryza sativa Japonica Group]|uniref:Uncharacterized protein n=1 Tax=Oryza sativa subsp. japonica TaxID=39947 RepID=B9G0F1_ORYSJ|nr:hypothetical protein OsJ_26955 [Oryza sativa Japonica Group]
MSKAGGTVAGGVGQQQERGGNGRKGSNPPSAMARTPSRSKGGAEDGRDGGEGRNGEVCALLILETVVVIWRLVTAGWG